MKATLEITAQKENLEVALGFLEEQLESAGCSMKQQMQIQVAAEELFINVASYAYAPDKGSVTIDFSCDESGLVSITFIDTGVPYDPTAKPDPDLMLSAAERPIGGLGILMVKKTMDSVFYKRENGCNVLTITKQLDL